MLEDGKSLGEVGDSVKLHNEAVSKYDISRRNLNKVKLHYKIRRREGYGTRRKKNAQKNEGDAGPDKRRVSDERRSQGR